MRLKRTSEKLLKINIQRISEEPKGVAQKFQLMGQLRYIKVDPCSSSLTFDIIKEKSQDEFQMGQDVIVDINESARGPSIHELEDLEKNSVCSLPEAGCVIC